jgi:hypothetical protein
MILNVLPSITLLLNNSLISYDGRMSVVHLCFLHLLMMIVIALSWVGMCIDHAYRWLFVHLMGTSIGIIHMWNYPNLLLILYHLDLIPLWMSLDYVPISKDNRYAHTSYFLCIHMDLLMVLFHLSFLINISYMSFLNDLLHLSLFSNNFLF